jgi:hypothetical protein
MYIYVYIRGIYIKALQSEEHHRCVFMYVRVVVCTHVSICMCMYIYVYHMDT